MCCSVLQYVAVHLYMGHEAIVRVSGVLQCIAVRCDLLQCGSLRCAREVTRAFVYMT